MPLNARLVVVGGEVKTAEIKLRLPTTIGRGRGSTIMLPHPLVSRQHCELYETDGRLMVRDLGSLNGTFINNERISEAPLPAGELLTIGAVTFRAVYDAAASSAPPPGPGPTMKSGKRRDTDANGTLRATDLSTSTAEERAEESVGEPVEAAGVEDFNFDQPLTPVDEASRLETPRPGQLPSASVVETVAAAGQKSAAETVPAQPKSPPGTGPGKPAAPGGPPAAKSPPPPQPAGVPPASAEKPVNFSAWELEDKVDPKGESDDDFGDFLKSLGEK